MDISLGFRFVTLELAGGLVGGLEVGEKTIASISTRKKLELDDCFVYFIWIGSTGGDDGVRS